MIEIQEILFKIFDAREEGISLPELAIIAKDLSLELHEVTGAYDAWNIWLASYPKMVQKVSTSNFVFWDRALVQNQAQERLMFAKGFVAYLPSKDEMSSLVECHPKWAGLSITDALRDYYREDLAYRPLALELGYRYDDEKATIGKDIEFRLQLDARTFISVWPLISYGTYIWRAKTNTDGQYEKKSRDYISLEPALRGEAKGVL